MVAAATPGSDLDALVAAEALLDGRIAQARARAGELRERARRHAAEDEIALEAELVAEHTRIAHEGEVAAAAAVRGIDEEAHDAVARYEAVAGERLVAVAVRLAERVCAIAAAEVVR